MYFFCQLCNYPLLTERAEPWKLVADTRVTGSKDLVASSSASGGNKCLHSKTRGGPAWTNKVLTCSGEILRQQKLPLEMAGQSRHH